MREQNKDKIRQKMQTLYFASVAHDLKTPLNAMMSSTLILKQSDLNNRHSEVLDMQDISGKFLLSLIDDILDLTRFQFNKFELNMAFFNIRESIKEMLKMVSYRAKARKIQLKCLISDNIDTMVFGDVKRIN
jgi:signal transduction histidine kinase